MWCLAGLDVWWSCSKSASAPSHSLLVYKYIMSISAVPDPLLGSLKHILYAFFGFLSFVSLYLLDIMSATLKSSKKSENQWKVATDNNPNIIATLVTQSYRAYNLWADPHNEPFYLRPLSQAVDGRCMVACNPESLHRVYSFLYFRSCYTIFLAVGIPRKKKRKKEKERKKDILTLQVSTAMKWLLAFRQCQWRRGGYVGDFTGYVADHGGSESGLLAGWIE